jgi:hypothetical protein
MYLNFETKQMRCCGALEIIGFPEDKDDEDYLEALFERDDYGDIIYRPTRNEVIEYVQKGLLQALKYRENKPYSHIIITLIESQNKLFGAMVKRLGFKCVGDRVNGNTLNRVWMYVRLRPEDKKPAKKKKLKNGTWVY